jgi:RHS repeat-associated protein
VPGSDSLAETDLAGNVVENYIYFNGQRVARREPTSPATVHFYFSDHLGTHSLITDLNGTMPPQSESDYFPYGAEVPISGADANHYKFTGKERDAESGLDNFGPRYDASSLGRFMSPDLLAGHVSDPQTLNRYAYVRNNPLNLTDPTGLDFNLTCVQTKDNASTCQNGVQGTTTTDTNGKSTFTATVISNDKNGNLVDQNGNQYNATVSGAGVSFTQAGSNQSSLGTFINGSNPTSLQATNMPVFSFTFTYSNPAGHVTAGGYWTYAGAPMAAWTALVNAGFHHYEADEYDILHPSTPTYNAIDFRSAGDPGTGANSGHFTLHNPWLLGNPFQSALGPTQGDVHLGEHNNNTPGGFWPHTQEVINYLRDKIGLY